MANNIKHKKLVFHPQNCFPASKLNRLQRGNLFVLLHQAGLLDARVRPNEQEQVKEHKKQADSLTLCVLGTGQESAEGASLKRSPSTAPGSPGLCSAEEGSQRLARGSCNSGVISQHPWGHLLILHVFCPLGFLAYLLPPHQIWLFHGTVNS